MTKLLNIGGDNMKVDAYDGDDSSGVDIVKEQNKVLDVNIIAPMITGIKQNDMDVNICQKLVLAPNFRPM